MKWSTILMPLGLALGVVAEPVPVMKRDLASFQKFLTDIEQGINHLTSLIQDYTGGPGTDVLEYNEELIRLIYDSVEIAEASEQLSYNDGLLLAAQISALMTSITPPIDLLIEKKQLGIENGIAYDVKMAITAMYDATEALGQAIKDKMDPAMKEVADSLNAEILADIQRGVDAYADVTGPEPTDTATQGPEPTETEPGPTGSETVGPTASPTDGPTATPTDGPTDGPTDTPGPTETGTNPPTPTDGCDAEETETVTVTVTECGEVPEPTDGNPPGDDDDDDGDDDTPPGGDDDDDDNDDNPTPPDFDGAGSINKVGSFGVAAAVAVVLAF